MIDGICAKDTIVNGRCVRTGGRDRSRPVPTFNQHVRCRLYLQIVDHPILLAKEIPTYLEGVRSVQSEITNGGGINRITICSSIENWYLGNNVKVLGNESHL